jgi:hypothetical protein
MKKLSKTARIRKMLGEDLSCAAIAAKMKVSKSYVYTVRSKMMRDERIKERINRAEERVAELPPSFPFPDPLNEQIGGDHYKDMSIQPVQFIVANNLGFLEGCIIKRVCRWRTKGGAEDLEKAKHELDLLIRLSDD